MKLNYINNLMRDVYNHDIDGLAANNPLSNQIQDALNHYDEVASKANHWMSIIPQALKSYNPEKDQQIKDQQELIELADGLINGKGCQFNQFEEKLNTYKQKYPQP